MKKRSVQAPAPTRLLLLIRHGKAAPKDIGLADFERVLICDGIGECRRMAKTRGGDSPFVTFDDSLIGGN